MKQWKSSASQSSQLVGSEHKFFYYFDLTTKLNIRSLLEADAKLFRSECNIM